MAIIRSFVGGAAVARRSFTTLSTVRRPFPLPCYGKQKKIKITISQLISFGSKILTSAHLSHFVKRFVFIEKLPCCLFLPTWVDVVLSVFAVNARSGIATRNTKIATFDVKMKWHFSPLLRMRLALIRQLRNRWEKGPPKRRNASHPRRETRHNKVYRKILPTSLSVMKPCWPRKIKKKM